MVSGEDPRRPLRPWRYDGMMNNDHFSGDMRFTRNGSGVNIDFRSGGREWRVWVNGTELLELLAGGQHGALRVSRAEGYARTGLGLLEPDAPRSYAYNVAADLVVDESANPDSVSGG